MKSTIGRLLIWIFQDFPLITTIGFIVLLRDLRNTEKAVTINKKEKENMENKSICAMCKHCNKEFNAKFTSDYECNLYSTIDVITGDIHYDFCHNHNSEGDCKDFTPSRWMKLRLWFNF